MGIFKGAFLDDTIQVTGRYASVNFKDKFTIM